MTIKSKFRNKPRKSIKHLANCNFWIFDLDNTLYPASCNLFNQVDKNMTRFIESFLNIDETAAHNLQKSYFKQYGTTLRGLMHNHAIQPMEFLEFVHDIDLTDIPPNPELSLNLEKLPGRKIIFTNGSVRHAENVTRHLGIYHHFQDIFDIVASNFIPKPNHSIYEDLVNKLSIVPSSAVMIEDIAKNLEPAALMGMSTVWINNSAPWASEGSNQSHIHYIIDNLTLWLEEIVLHVNK